MIDFSVAQEPTGIQQVQSYESNGKPQQNQDKSTSRLGVNFSKLVGGNLTVQTPTAVITETTSKRKKKAKISDSGEALVTIGETGVSDPANSKEIVETTIYSETYRDTNAMAYGIIRQSDQLLNDCKAELDYIRSQRSMKGRYHYMNDTINAMSSLLGTKLSAIKEINSTIKAVNDNEYRRFKDMRAVDSMDDNKAIMDAYTAFISAPVGAPSYTLPNTMNMTGGLNGIIRADYPSDVQAGMDMGMANYLANLTPEEALMLHDTNKDIEEVIVYDQATGVKQFKWMNTKTGETLDNLPPSSNITIEDYTIDPRTRTAKNINLNNIKKVVVLNEGQFDKF